MAAKAPPAHLDSGETPAERLTRNLAELLGELRVALPGVQVLFAFLLIVPFSSRFATLSSFEKDLYFGVLLCTALSSALLIAPTAYHRMQFRRGRRHELVMFANRAALLGLAALAIAMTGAILLITHVLFGGGAAIATAIVSGAIFAGLWYAVPWLGTREG
jgi:hypothetical protein